MKKTWLFLTALLWTGCISPYTWVGVQPEVVTMAGGFSVKGDPVWNRLEGGPDGNRPPLWTAHGSPLDQLRFYPGIGAGRPLVVEKGQLDKQTGKFQPSMQPEEIVELYEALATQGGSTFRREKLAPFAFAGGSGFRFEFILIRKGDDVVLKGVGYGVVQKDTLFLMVFQAPRIHYYEAMLPKVEALARSARIG